MNIEVKLNLLCFLFKIIYSLLVYHYVSWHQLVRLLSLSLPEDKCQVLFPSKACSNTLFPFFFERASQIRKFLKELKQEGSLNTMHILLVYLQQSPIQQRPLAAALLLQLDLLVWIFSFRKIKFLFTSIILYQGSMENLSACPLKYVM